MTSMEAKLDSIMHRMDKQERKLEDTTRKSGEPNQ